MYEASVFSPCPGQAQEPLGSDRGVSQPSAQGPVGCRSSPKAPACPAKCLRPPHAILASEPARCDSEKSVKETDDREKLKTNEVTAAFWVLRQMETLGNQAE